MNTTDVKFYLDNYKIVNSNLCDNINNIIVDENIINNYKIAVLIYNYAKQLKNEDISRRTPVGFEYYINNAIERLSVNGEKNNYSINHIINGIVEGNGKYQTRYGEEKIKGTIFDYFIEPKKDYIIALLKKKFEERNEEFNELNISIDNSEFNKLGSSLITINCNVVPKIKNDNLNVGIQYETKDILTNLTNKMNEAKSNNDSVLYNYYKNNIIRIIKEKPLNYTDEEWNNLKDNQKKEYCLIKMKESKLLNDVDAFNYWNSTYSNITGLEIEKPSIKM